MNGVFDRFHEVDPLLRTALERSPEERRELLVEVRRADPALGEALAEMLRLGEEEDDLLVEGGALDAGVVEGLGEAPVPPSPLAGKRLGPWRLIRELGRGGMAIVYLAERADGAYEKQVAVKLPQVAPGSGSQHRFERERQILASLEHPNIARLIDGGLTEEGQPWFAMELVAGEPIDRYSDARRLTVEERLALFVRVVEAVQAAHERRIVHRDLKPSNILVAADGSPRLLDFGIARLVDPEAPDSAAGTLLLLTPEYASPEQVLGLAVSPASDVYQLGLLLYELLTGVRPQRVAGRTVGELERVILEQSPSRPSLAVGGGEEAADRAARRGCDAPGLARRLRGDLDSIVLQAIRKEPERRYGSAAQLASDVERHLQGRAVSARRESLVDRVAPRIRRAKKLPVALAALALGALIASTPWFLPSPAITSGPQPVTDPTAAGIAVLPFTDLGPTGDDGYLAHGLGEALATTLSGVEGVRLVAPASVRALHARGVEARDIGRRLGAATVLSGTLDREGERLRVTARLVDVGDGRDLWSQTYERGPEDLLAIQEAISRALVERLEGGSVRDAATAIRRQAVDPEAYNLYLQGRFSWHRRTHAGLLAAVDSFERVVEIEPAYAPAWVGLADAYAVLGFYDYLPPAEAFPRAAAAARQALALDADLAQPHATLGYVDLYYHWDWNAAERRFLRAIEMAPGYSTAYQWYANLLTATARFEEAEDAIRHAQELDPLSLIANASLGWVFYYAGHYEEAVDQYRRTLELAPDFELAHYWEGLALEELGRRQESRAALLRAFELSDGSDIVAAALARSHHLDGDTAGGDALAKTLDREPGEGYTPAFELAKVALSAGRRDEALTWLERAREQRSHSMAFLMVDPQLAPLRDDPRFVGIAEQVGHRPAAGRRKVGD